MKLKKREEVAPVVEEVVPQEDLREVLDMGQTPFSMLLDEAYNIQALCVDHRVTRANNMNIRLNSDGNIVYVPDDGGVLTRTISRHAMGQLCNKIGVPHEYMKKCIKTGRVDLASDNIDSWLSDFNKDLFIREFDGRIRGVLTPRYSVCDTPTILENLADSFPVDDFTIKGYFLNEERLHLRLVSPEKLNVPNEVLFPGFSIDSSDVGRANLTVSFFIWKQVCTNGLVVPRKFGQLFSQVHRGITPENFQSALSETYKLANEVIDKVAESIKNTATLSLEDTFKGDDDLQKLIYDVRRTTLLSEQNAGKVIELMQNGTYQKNRWGLINSITQVAQSFTLDERVRLESVAGELLVA